MNTAEPSPDTEDDPLVQYCATCGAAIDISDEEPLSLITCPACGAPETVSGLVDKYELQEVVGRGGMGVVFKAYDRGLDRFVALKLLRRDKSSSSVVEQLQQEAQVTASINHPHVVRVFTSGTDHGRFFIAMELVDKGTLDELIHLQGRVAEAQVLEVGSQIAQGLRAALQAGLIHRDVKPGNILFADAHTAKIVDFGLAIFQADEESQRGEVWGTPYYVAPEKLDHKPEDFRSDMYSLGGTLFHALAGRPPFEAEDASMVALKHLKSQAVSLQAFAPHVSAEAAYVINRTLSKDPNDRYQSYDELIEHLDYALENLQAHGGQPRPTKRVVLEDAEQQRAMGWITAATFGVILLLGVGALVFRKTMSRGSDEVSPPPAVAVVDGKAGPFPEAWAKLAAGNTSAAIEMYRERLADPKQPPIQHAWANFGEGLGQLIAGQPVQAQNAFETLAERAPFKSRGEDEKMDTFLRQLSREMSTKAPVRAADAKSLSLTNHQALAVFAYGVKDWAMGQTEDASALLRQFQTQANPGGNYAWINDLKPLVKSLLDEQAAFQALAERFEAAARPELRAKVLTDLRKLKGPFKLLTTELEKKVTAPKPVALPKLGEWSQAEFGPPDVVPSVTLDPAGAFSISAGGSDLWNNSDNGHFIYRQMQGDGELVARIESVSKTAPLTKAGLMMRDSLKPDARNVALMVLAGGGLSQQIRAKASNSTTDVKALGSAPHWLKLTRKGDEITGYRSADGDTWTQIAVQKLDQLPPNIYVGLAVASNSPTAAATVKIGIVGIGK